MHSSISNNSMIIAILPNLSLLKWILLTIYMELFLLLMNNKFNNIKNNKLLSILLKINITKYFSYN